MKKLIVILLCLILTAGVFGRSAFAQSGDLMILNQPQEGFFPEYSVAFYEVKAYGTGDLTYRWYLIFQGETYDLSKPTGSQPWEAFAGEDYGGSPTGTSYHFGGILKGLDGAKIYCTVSDGENTVTSEQIRVNVGAEGTSMPPTFTVPASLEVQQGAIADLYCNATDPKGGTVSYEWSFCQKGDPYTREEIAHESAFTDTLHCDTDEVGTYYVVCKMSTTSGGTALTHAIPVVVMGETVTESDSEQSDLSVPVTDGEGEVDSSAPVVENTGTEGSSDSSDMEEEILSSEDRNDAPAGTETSVTSEPVQESEGVSLALILIPAAVVLVGGGSAGFFLLRKRK